MKTAALIIATVSTWTIVFVFLITVLTLQCYKLSFILPFVLYSFLSFLL